METTKLDDGFVKYDLHQTDGPVQTVPTRSDEKPEDWFKTVDGTNYSAITPDGYQFSGGMPAYASGAPFDVQGAQDGPPTATRLSLVDPSVAQSLLQHTGHTDHNFGFVDPQDKPPATLGDHIHGFFDGWKTAASTVKDLATLPNQLAHVGDDIE